VWHSQLLVNFHHLAWDMQMLVLEHDAIKMAQDYYDAHFHGAGA
jgi:hypothetical protein